MRQWVLWLIIVALLFSISGCRVDSRWMASYGLDLLEYYYEYEENSYVVREGFSTEVWTKYPVYKPSIKG